MVVFILFYDLHLPHSRGLKEKRALIRPLKARLRNDFEISAAEVAHQDLLQRAGIGVAAVGADAEALEPLAERVSRYVASYAEENGLEIAAERHELLELGDPAAAGSFFGTGAGEPEEAGADDVEDPQEER